MSIKWSESLRRFSDKDCFVGGALNESWTYGRLADRVVECVDQFRAEGISAGSVVAFAGQYTGDMIACFLALAEMGTVAVPLPDDASPRIDRLIAIAQAPHRVTRKPDGVGLQVSKVDSETSQVHPLYQKLQEAGHSGLVLFTSGTTGDPKAAVQDLDRMQLRYAQPRAAGKMLAFMHMDHIGGMNTLLFSLSHGGSLIVPQTRTPHDVARAIQEHRIETLPVSPTFLNLFLLSGAVEQFDVSSLRRITYGSEPMPESVLTQLSSKLPGVELLQTYGTTELGILKSKSENNQSLWMRLGGEGYETKVVDGRLWVKAQTTMLGYLNAPSALDADGFMDTGDAVEVRGDLFRILGRKSDFINVGGTKVSPVEIESILLEMPCVREAAIVARPHPLLGQVVEARVVLNEGVTQAEFKTMMRSHCLGRVPTEAIPAKVTIATGVLATDRFKRDRS